MKNNYKTNSDRIRSMTDEELAKFITEDRWDCNDCPFGQENMDNPFATKCDNKCFKHCLEWLKKEHNYEDEVEPVTNRDKINSMTNKEFAAFYLSNNDEYCDSCIYNWHSCEGEDCHSAMVKWLNSRVKEGKNNG